MPGGFWKATRTGGHAAQKRLRTLMSDGGPLVGFLSARLWGRLRLSGLVLLICAPAVAAPWAETIHLRQGDGSVVWEVRPETSAILLVDVWSNHWCNDLRDRVDAKASTIGVFVDLMRKHGVTILHAPSAAIREYVGHPAVRNVRPAIVAARGVEPPEPQAIARPALAEPFRGMKLERCISGEARQRTTPLRQHAAIHIDERDYMSVSAREIWALAHAKGLEHLFYVGFAAGNCVIGRQFGMLPMAELGLKVALLRDLTDVDFTVVDPPMSNAEATDLVVREIEKVVGPSIASDELAAAFATDKPIDRVP